MVVCQLLLSHVQLPEKLFLEKREMEILGLIAKGLSNQEIADRLFISLSTVKGHNQSIFGKLQVKRRAEAIVRARELGLAQKQYPKQYSGLLIPMPSPCFFRANHRRKKWIREGK